MLTEYCFLPQIDWTLLTEYMYHFVRMMWNVYVMPVVRHTMGCKLLLVFLSYLQSINYSDRRYAWPQAYTDDNFHFSYLAPHALS